MQALEALGYEPTVYHLNEGHAAFAPIYRTAKLIREGLSKEDAIERIRKSTVFTTHTPGSSRT